MNDNRGHYRGFVFTNLGQSYNTLEAITLILDLCSPQSAVVWRNVKLQKDESIVRQTDFQYLKNKAL